MTAFRQPGLTGFAPAGLGGFDMADLMRCWVSVFPLVQATRTFNPEPLMTPYTRCARVSSIYDKVM